MFQLYVVDVLKSIFARQFHLRPKDSAEIRDQMYQMLLKRRVQAIEDSVQGAIKVDPFLNIQKGRIQVQWHTLQWRKHESFYRASDKPFLCTHHVLMIDASLRSQRFVTKFTQSAREVVAGHCLTCKGVCVSMFIGCKFVFIKK